jgi:glutaredoxin
MYCVMAKKFFDDNNIRYENIDVSADETAAQEMIEKSGQMGVPVIEIEDDIIVGFDRDRIMKALGLKK